jgi:MFS family permease
MEIDLNKRYQTMFVLWFAMLMSVLMYFLFSLFVTPNISNEANNSTMKILIVALSAVSTFCVIVSFPIKNKIMERSVERQDSLLVQKAMLIALAMCEVSALLGLLEHFVVGNREYYLLFLLAAGGMALHFPRRSQLEAASYQSRTMLVE